MMEESIEEELHAPPPSSSPEIDSVYEFDASQFFDFTRPESPSAAEKAERWFQLAGYYPPSQEEEAKESPLSKDCIFSEVSSSNGKMMRGTTYDSNQTVEDTPKAKSKSTTKSSKPRSSTLMKPTASQLAKQNHALHDNQATKRQKLESGYMPKVAHLKHETSLLHKSSKMGGLSPPAKTLYSRLNVTVPRGPNLETRRRAQWRRFRSKNDLDSSENVTEKAIAFKARPLNKNIVKSPSTSQHKKSTRISPTSQVIMDLLESKVSNDGKLLQHPPIQLFSKLSLKSDMDTGAVYQQKHHPFDKVNLRKHDHKLDV